MNRDWIKIDAENKEIVFGRYVTRIVSNADFVETLRMIVWQKMSYQLAFRASVILYRATDG